MPDKKYSTTAELREKLQFLADISMKEKLIKAAANAAALAEIADHGEMKPNIEVLVSDDIKVLKLDENAYPNVPPIRISDATPQPETKENNYKYKVTLSAIHEIFYPTTISKNEEENKENNKKLIMV